MNRALEFRNVGQADHVPGLKIANTLGIHHGISLKSPAMTTTAARPTMNRNTSEDTSRPPSV